MKQKNYANGLITNHSVILEHLLSLKGVVITGYLQDRGTHIVIIERAVREGFMCCNRCGSPGRVHGWRSVDLIDLPCIGRPLTLRWRKQRMRCTNRDCLASWTVQDSRIASQRCRLTTRAARWCVLQVVRGSTIMDIARELHCDWHTVERAVSLYGSALLKADKKRVQRTKVIGLDETAFLSHRANQYHGTRYVTTICDLEHRSVIDIAPSRDKYEVARLLAKQSQSWRDHIQFGTLDLSSLYRAVFNIATPQAQCIADPFHVVKQANERLDQVRRRVQWTTTGHRGRKTDPLYTIRRRLVTGIEKLNEKVLTRVHDALSLGDPDGEIMLAWRIKEAVRDIYKQSNKQAAVEQYNTIITICTKPSSPPELQSLAHTLTQWRKEILAYIEHQYSNGVTEGINNRIKKIKRDGYGYRNFNNYRLRILLTLGGIHTNILNSITIP